MLPQANAHPCVLVVDDEPQIVEVVEKYLRDEGFDVLVAYDGLTAVATFQQNEPDLVLLDLNLPALSGMEAFRRIRSQSQVPVIMLTSRTNEVDRVLGLELGADDYITKPFSPREVTARVKAVLRRSVARADPAIGGLNVKPGAALSDGRLLQVGDLQVDEAAHEVRVRGSAVDLTPTEFRIIAALAANPGRTFTRAQLLDRIKAEDLEIYDRTLDRHIANLRHKIELDPAKPKYVLTVFGVGYKLAKS